MRARLIPLDGSPPIELVKDLTLVGRGEECDLRIESKSISKKHCVLVKTDGLILLRDLGSTNGTRVNGQRVRRGSLLPNDHLAIANFRYLVKFGETSESHAGDGDAGKFSVDVAENAESEPELPGLADGPPLKLNELPDEYPAQPAKRTT
jgi:pSer/pThr/pTyr-binding forkhead associated (FHA) protein